MRKRLAFLALPALLVLVGCEGSPVPLSAPGDAAIRSELLGEWRTVDEDGAELMLRVLGFNRFEYVAVVETLDGDPPSLFRMYESDVDGAFFANVQCLDCEDEDQEYLFGRFTVQDGFLLTEWLEDSFYESIAGAERAEDALHALTESLRKDRVEFAEAWKWSRVDH